MRKTNSRFANFFKKEENSFHRLTLVVIVLAVLGIVVLYSNFRYTGLVSGDYTDEATCLSEGYSWSETIEPNCTVIDDCLQCAEGCSTGTVCEDECVPEYTQVLCEENCQQEPCGENDSGCVQCTEGCVPSYTEVLCAEGCVQEEDLCELDCQETCETCEDILVGTCIDGICGDGITNTGELCDNAEFNGQQCTADYDSSCQYCSSDCQLTTLLGGTCGDGNCDNEESCSSCESDCGVCADDSDDDSDSSSDDEVQSTKQVAVTAKVIQKKVCTPNWQCGDWQECIDGTQIRMCTDSEECNSTENIPETSQSCVVEIKETCFDEVKNQDEKGIDCGGVCEKKCGIFTIVGSAISVPLDAGREFVLKQLFSTIPRIIISTTVLVFIIAGFIVSKFFLKKSMDIKKLDKAIDNLSTKKK